MALVVLAGLLSGSAAFKLASRSAQTRKQPSFANAAHLFSPHRSVSGERRTGSALLGATVVKSGMDVTREPSSKAAVYKQRLRQVWKRLRLGTASFTLFVALYFSQVMGIRSARASGKSVAPTEGLNSIFRNRGLNTDKVMTKGVAKVEILVSDQQYSKGKESSIKKVGQLGKNIANSLSIKGKKDNVPPTSVRNEIDKGILSALRETEAEFEATGRKLLRFFQGSKLDTLILLLATSVVIPFAKSFKFSPILGFLLTGTILGPNGLNYFNDVHTIDMLGELGIVFFLFEMGLELSIDRLKAMRKDVFGLGTSQFLLTTAVGASVATAFGISAPAAFTIGASLSLSSSAFVLQLLKDKDAVGSRFGKASFGILLLQDLAVVPVLVVVELLSKGGEGLGKALFVAAMKALLTLSTMSFAGKQLLDRLFHFVAKSSSQEAFLSIILSTVLVMSFFTQGIGLSNTLGAFLAGLCLAETKYKYQIESDIAPFRGVLLGIFFITVGFSIDLSLIISKSSTILSMLVLLISTKAAIITMLGLIFGINLASSQQAGLMNAQAGEFAFVAFGIAERGGLISPQLTKLLLTTVAVSMAATPALAELGESITNRIEANKGFNHIIGDDEDAKEVKEDTASDFVFVCGYGRVGKMVCDMLDKKFIRYVAIDNSPAVAIEARSKGKPVFFGDANRPEVLSAFNVGKSRAAILTIDDLKSTNKAIISLRKNFPELPVVVRAKNKQHQDRLETLFPNVQTICPMLPEDSVILTLPFGGAVLQSLGVAKPEINAIMEEARSHYMTTDDDAKDFFTSFQRRLPASSSSTRDSEERENALELGSVIKIVEKEDKTLAIDPLQTNSSKNFNPTMTNNSILSAASDQTVLIGSEAEELVLEEMKECTPP